MERFGRIFDVHQAEEHAQPPAAPLGPELRQSPPEILRFQHVVPYGNEDRAVPIPEYIIRRYGRVMLPRHVFEVLEEEVAFLSLGHEERAGTHAALCYASLTSGVLYELCCVLSSVVFETVAL